MEIEKLKPFNKMFLSCSIMGFCLINIPFLYYAFVERSVYAEAIDNGMALLFITEAFLIMLFIAFVISKISRRKYDWLLFILLSLLGSIAFSLPFYLFLVTKNTQELISADD